MDKKSTGFYIEGKNRCVSALVCFTTCVCVCVRMHVCRVHSDAGCYRLTVPVENHRALKPEPQTLQFSTQAEKCMIRAQLTCLKSPGEEGEEMAPYAAPCGHSVLKPRHRSLSGSASLPEASNHRGRQTTPPVNTRHSRVKELKSHSMRRSAHLGIQCILLHVCHAPGFQLRCQPRYASDMDPVL